VLFILPIFLVLLGNFFIFKLAPEFSHKHATGSTAKSWYLVFHVLVVALCVVHADFIYGMRQASGFCGALRRKDYCFTSAFFFLENYRAWLLVSGVLFPVVGIIVKDILYKGRELSREFDFWRLIGAVGEYQPAYGDEIIYVNSASMAPSIKSINNQTMSYYYKYQRAVPTSDIARNFLLERAEAARALLNRYLLNDDKHKKLLHAEFFPGTSRALEAGILRIGDITHIVLSPYEHPSQVDVVRWLCETQRDITYTDLRPQSPAFFQGGWSQQKTQVCEALEKEISKKPTGKVAIVLSEVHYITGIHVRVGEIMEELRRRNNNLVFIVDGSQAVGNLAKPLSSFAGQLVPNDFYYFSAHKWLLSPNTCGVLISQVTNSQLHPYDVFGFTLPTSTIDPNTIFGLVSALEFLFDGRGLFGRFSEISRFSREQFRAIVSIKDSKLEIVESVTTDLSASLFLAVRPGIGYRWKYDNKSFWEEIRRRGVDLTVIPEGVPHFEGEKSDGARVDSYLLRVSFPYFLTGKNVKNLVGHLNALIVRAN
jgi:hypothetical protein